MLSAQLAATALNIAYGAQGAGVLVNEGGTWKPLSQVVQNAAAFLAAEPVRLPSADLPLTSRTGYYPTRDVPPAAAQC